MDDNNLGYDEDALAHDLRAWWDDEVGGGENDPFANPKAPSGTIFDVIPLIDSLGAVTGLITVERHVGFNVPPRVIRPGGYSSFDDFVGDLLPKVRAIVERRAATSARPKQKEAI